MAVTVIFAVYGALKGGDPDQTKAWDVRQALRTAINNAPGQIVKIDNSTMGGDPVNGVKKHFGAVVDVNGTKRPFACEENQTIDFT